MRKIEVILLYSEWSHGRPTLSTVTRVAGCEWALALVGAYPTPRLPHTAWAASSRTGQKQEASLAWSGETQSRLRTRASRAGGWLASPPRPATSPEPADSDHVVMRGLWPVIWGIRVSSESEIGGDFGQNDCLRPEYCSVCSVCQCGGAGGVQWPVMMAARPGVSDVSPGHWWRGPEPGPARPVTAPLLLQTWPASQLSAHTTQNNSELGNYVSNIETASLYWTLTPTISTAGTENTCIPNFLPRHTIQIWRFQSVFLYLIVIVQEIFRTNPIQLYSYHLAYINA